MVISPEEKAANDLRLAYEDAIRNNYVSTFVKPSANDPENGFLVASRGNWREISHYFEQIKSGSKSRYRDGIRLLSLISEKDLRDTPASVLLDHLNNFCGVDGMYPQQRRYGTAMYLIPVLAMNCSRAGERIQTSRFRPLWPQERDCMLVRDNIKVLDRYNPQRIPMTPLGVHSLQAADAFARLLFCSTAAPLTFRRG